MANDRLTQLSVDRAATIARIEPLIRTLVESESQHAIEHHRGVVRKGSGRKHAITLTANTVVDVVSMLIGGAANARIAELERNVAVLSERLAQNVIDVGDFVTTRYRPDQFRGKTLRVKEVLREKSDLGDMLTLAVPGGVDITILAAYCDKVAPVPMEGAPS